MRQFAEIALLLLGRIGKGFGIAARGHHQIDVDADHPVRMRITEPAGDRGAPVAALRAEAGKAEDVMHEGGNAVRHFWNAVPLLAGLEGKPVSRQGRRHHGEGIAGVATEARGIGETRNDIEELEHRAGPAVQQAAAAWGQGRHRARADNAGRCHRSERGIAEMRSGLLPPPSSQNRCANIPRARADRRHRCHRPTARRAQNRGSVNGPDDRASRRCRRPGSEA